jgi:hypothetical protein
VFGLFAPPVSFRAQTGQAGQLYIDLPGIEPGREKTVLRALGRMGRVQVRSKSHDFGQVRVEFHAAFESYSLHCNGGGGFIRGESGGDEIAKMLNFMRKSRRFREIETKRKK